MALYLLAPRLGKRSLARFDRDVVQLLARGERAGLDARYRRALGMRLFAAPAIVAERRGLCAAEVGSPERARAAYHDALEGYGPGEAPLSVRLGLAHACYALGDDEEAIRNYRAVAKESGGLPRVTQSFAHSLARRGEDLEEAERMAEQLLADAGASPPAEPLLLRALVHAKRGQKGPARKILKTTSDTDSELAARLRAEIESEIASGGATRPSA
jgi:Tfp pilus assembly protein PilF